MFVYQALLVLTNKCHQYIYDHIHQRCVLSSIFTPSITYPKDIIPDISLKYLRTIRSTWPNKNSHQACKSTYPRGISSLVTKPPKSLPRKSNDLLTRYRKTVTGYLDFLQTQSRRTKEKRTYTTQPISSRSPQSRHRRILKLV